jgi:TRAP transporter TatT component family protein
VAGDPALRSRLHFDRAVAISKGQAASPYVSYAEAVSLSKQNRAEFESMLRQALAIDPNAKPEWRLENLIMQERARWLLARTSDLFLGAPPDTLANRSALANLARIAKYAKENEFMFVRELRVLSRVSR